MKTRYLLAFLFFLISIAYLVDQGSDNSSSQFFKQIDSLSFDKYKFMKKQSLFFDSHLKLEVEKKYFEQILKTLQEIKILKKVRNSKEQSVILSFKFNSRNIVFSSLNKLTGAFSLIIDNQEYLAESLTDFDGVYTGEVDRKIKSYQSMLGSLKRKQSEILTSALGLRNLEILEREIIKGKQKTIFDFKKKQTFPKPLTGLFIDEQKLHDLYTKLSNIKVLNIKRSENCPFKVQSFLYVIEGSQTKELMYGFYQNDNYLYDSERKLLFKTSKEESQYLFESVKETWSGKAAEKVLKDNTVYSLTVGEKKFQFRLNREGKAFGESKILKKKEAQILQELLCYTTFCHPKYKFFLVETNQKLLEENFLILGDEKIRISFNKHYLKIKNENQQIVFTYLIADKEFESIIYGLFN